MYQIQRKNEVKYGGCECCNRRYFNNKIEQQESATQKKEELEMLSSKIKNICIQEFKKRDSQMDVAEMDVDVDENEIFQYIIC